MGNPSRPGAALPASGPASSLETTAGNCEREPIHLPGSIQPLGALVAFEPASGIVLHASTNLDCLLPVTTAPESGAVLPDWLGAAGYALLERALAERTDGAVRHQIVDLPARPAQGQPAALQAVVHAHGGVNIAEFELTTPLDQQRDWLQLLGDTVDSLRGASDLDDLVERIAQRVKRLTRFDRVMVYRFDQDASGHVLADVREPEMESFLDLHYPASDIPAQARDLYRSNLVRYISDVGYRPVPVVPWRHFGPAAPLDLSHAMLRSASPMHVQYLRNMGVASTLTLSLVIENRLWGLIACHHRTATALPVRLWRACHALSVNAGFLVGWNEQRQRAAAGVATQKAQAEVVESFNQVQVPLADVIEGCSAILLKMTGASGGAFWRDSAVLPFGQWPQGARGASILQYLRGAFEKSPDAVVDTDRVALRPPLADSELQGVCGVMAVRLNSAASCGVAWLRPELPSEVDWGGNPEQPMQVGTDAQGVPRFTPRASFARWATLVKGCCRPWTDLDRAAAAALLVLPQVLNVRDSLAQLSVSDRHFRSLVTLQSDAYWQLDARGRVAALSKPLFGAGSALGMTPAELLGPYCDAAGIAALEQALHRKAPFRGLRLHGRDPVQRREFELQINGEPMRDPYGRAAGWHGTMTDVTREVALHASVQQREAERQAMLDNDLIGILKVREERIVWKNRAIDRIFGFGPDELFGETTRPLHLDDATYQSTRAAADRAIRTSGHYRDQVQMKRSDGGHVWIDVHMAPLSAPSQDSLWLLVDITLLQPEHG